MFKKRNLLVYLKVIVTNRIKTLILASQIVFLQINYILCH